MPEFKIVISDPEAANTPIKKIKAKGSANLEFNEKMKNQVTLPKCIAHPSLLKELQAKYRIITLRFQREDRRYKLTCIVEEDENIGENEVLVPLEWIGEKLEAEEAEGEAFRARAWQIAIGDPKASSLLGMKIGDIINGDIVGLPGVKLEIRGGSDKAGFPMHPAIQGAGKHRVLLPQPPGFHPRRKGERRRKMVRGNTIGPDIVQVNTVIVH